MVCIGLGLRRWMQIQIFVRADKEEIQAGIRPARAHVCSQRLDGPAVVVALEEYGRSVTPERRLRAQIERGIMRSSSALDDFRLGSVWLGHADRGKYSGDDRCS